MSAWDTSLQKPDLNRHNTPYEGAAFPVEPFCKNIKDVFRGSRQMDMQAYPFGSLLRENCGYRSRTCYLQLMRLKLVIPFHPPAKPVPGIEPGSSAWKADVLTVTPHGQEQVTGLEPVNPPWQSGALPITRYLHKKASRRAPGASDACLAPTEAERRSNRQPADYETAALPLRQRSMIGAAGIEPASSAYKTGALPLDEAPETGTAGIEPATPCL